MSIRLCMPALCAVLAGFLAGCGEPETTVTLGSATPERRAQFAGAVARACAGYDGLDGPDVKIEVTKDAKGCALKVSSETLKKSVLQHSLSVALTNLSLEYPGLVFMYNDDGSWSVLMPDDIRIPVSGSFGIGG